MLFCYCLILVVQTLTEQQTADSDNNIFGRTLNPSNTALTAGGSSGGEGAIVAFRGSPLGIGTDVAGSIRIPASCCGTYGFKPTVNRIPFGGQAIMSDLGLRAIMACAGPLANDIDALEILVKAVIDHGPARYDAKAFDLPWRGIDVQGRAEKNCALACWLQIPSYRCIRQWSVRWPRQCGW